MTNDLLNSYFQLKHAVLNVIPSKFILTTKWLFIFIMYHVPIDILIFYNDFNIPATNKYNSLVMNKIKKQKWYARQWYK